MKLYAIAGKARTGKDTVAMRLVSKHHYAAYKFAQPLKVALASMFGLSYQQIEGDEKERVIDWIGKSPRQLMQTLGTEWGRELIAPDIWLRVAQQQYNYAQQSNAFQGMIISDCRFENEAQWVRSNGGTVVHLFRGDAPSVAEHVSENGVLVHQDIDISIQNGSTLTDLYTQVDFMVS